MSSIARNIEYTMPTSVRRCIYWCCTLSLTLVVIVCNARLYSSVSVRQPASDVLLQLRYLEGEIHNGADSVMQEQFPEGLLFSNALYGLAWLEQARSVPSLQQHALREAAWALQRMESPMGKAPFDSQLAPPYGVFHTGWTALLRGAMLELQQPTARDTAELRHFAQQCHSLADAFANSSTPFLSSYRTMAWPADNVVAIAALQLHDHVLTARYTELIATWLQRVRERLDTATGLIPHAVEYRTGVAMEGARGSSQSLMLRFLPMIDTAFAQEQYQRYRRLFVTSFVGLPLVREYPRGSTGTGDIDSGPVLLGIGPAATIVGLGAARTFGDTALAVSLAQTLEFLGFPYTWGERKCYALGAMSIGDGFLAWAKTATPRCATARVFSPPWWWRVPVHTLSLVLLALVWLPALRQVAQKKH